MSNQHPEAERLAELHWISYGMTARIRDRSLPMWEDLKDTERGSLVTAMDLMLQLGHLKVGFE